MSVLLGDRNGTLRPRVQYATMAPKFDLVGIVIADLNGDKRSDLVAGSSGMLTVLLNTCLP